MNGQMVRFQAGKDSSQGFLSTPANRKGPGIVVIQEWWGLVPHIKEICDRFAAEGFVALAPDLYHGKTTTSPDDAGKLMMALNIDDAEKELRGAIEYLRRHEAVEPKAVGTIGFCMGGALSLYAACKNPQVAACVVFYGGHPNVKPDVARLQAPMLGIYAEKDGFVTVESVRELERQLKAHNKQAEIHIYPGVDHAFFNDSRPGIYNKEAAEEGLRRTLEFFRKHLK